MTKQNQIAYMYGNAAPQLQPQQTPIEKPFPSQQEEMEKRRLLRERRKLARQKRMSAINFVLMSMATAMIFGMCATYIQLQSELNRNMSKVAELESTLIALRTDNDIVEKRIETSVNFEQIKNRAINELGMVYPSRDQIIYYHIDESDYMEQYEEIPGAYDDTIFGMILH